MHAAFSGPCGRAYRRRVDAAEFEQDDVVVFQAFGEGRGNEFYTFAAGQDRMERFEDVLGRDDSDEALSEQCAFDLRWSRSG
ncbi:hypothetical protein [Phytoactinopolyspora mesophila]|uniref:Uncharacterized protein n=1 Tax=Phytoactinopolyspora mesophila TaxID=2650750 RepID=A0A7K3LXF6_9ACTN|nr:hypothetical protein [Phytoactinopolyspora mesophila]NDL55701.1 hypothetical protein [Phytoactinopolyspora mesophila]